MVLLAVLLVRFFVKVFLVYEEFSIFKSVGLFGVSDVLYGVKD